MPKKNKYILWFDEINLKDVSSVGGKNASLGEMVCTFKNKGISVPLGFAITTEAYWQFLGFNGLRTKLKTLFNDLEKGNKSLAIVGKQVRELFYNAELPEEITQAIVSAYKRLCEIYNFAPGELDVAVRSSSTAEDLADASFAGLQETFLNVTGEKNLVKSCKKCFASLFTDRAISYRQEKGFDHMNVALSVGVQKMVRSDKGSSGVMFSIDTETGFRNAVVINAGWGLGENIVQGSITPDEYMVFKPLLGKNNIKPIIGRTLGGKEKKLIYTKNDKSKTTKNIKTSNKEKQNFVLNDNEILKLAEWATIIEAHYNKPMDIEWAKDGETSKLFIVQARPETVESRKTDDSLKIYELKQRGEELLTGIRIGEAIASGKVCKIMSPDEIDKFEDGSILVTEMTDPDWVPVMKRAAGIITNQGGRTCHASIVSRELGIPAIVGTSKATDILKNGDSVTISCAEGDHGVVYKGILKFVTKEIDFKDVPKIKTKIMMNIGSPASALRWWRLPCNGIGLARTEFIISDIIKVHPMALVHFNEIKDKKICREIENITYGYKSKEEYFIDKLACGISTIAASQYPNPVIVRMSDFKTNEYANLIGGSQFEQKEENPMLGFRGASRYYNEKYKKGFALECKAIKKAREVTGLKNIIVMIPFCRTVEEADKVIEVLAENGLKQRENELQIYMMCEIPSNVLLAYDFAKRFDGFSIGSNDLTQLVLGVDRDSSELANLFDERNEAVKIMIRNVIDSAHKVGCKVGICGQAPSDYPEFAEFLVKSGIDSISLNPDCITNVMNEIAIAEKRKLHTVEKVIFLQAQDKHELKKKLSDF